MRLPMRRTCALWLAAAPALAAGPAMARILHVGPGEPYAMPSAAAASAEAGDTVLIAPGTYFDCAVWTASGLTIEGEGEGATLTDKPCNGKAAFVVAGNDVTIRNLTFTRIRVPDGNGAGIRAEGRNLTVAGSRFDNNQVGILAAGQGGVLRVSGSRFTANGAGSGETPLHAVLAGGLDLLRIEGSTFGQARGGGHIISSAARTELVANQLSDEGSSMTGPLVTVQGGSLLLDGNLFVLAPGNAPRPGAVLATGGMTALTVQGNTLTAPGGSVALVRNWTGAAVTETGNTVPPGTDAVSAAGATYHRLRAEAAALRDQAKDATRTLRHWLAVTARSLGVLH